ncbi:MAG: thioesterase family protein [Nocardiopsaceae bacterium]|nr:thioesterase family protein [Nocardiopsaceae bacterium]
MTGSDGEAPEAYYRTGPDGAFTPTIATESPWDTKAQHGGPPCALFGHVIRENHPGTGFRIARLTVEFLGTIPRSDVTVKTEVIRDGRRIRLIEASMRSAGKTVALARAWQIATSGGVLDGAELKDAKSVEMPALPPPEPARRFSGDKGRWGYSESVDWRRVRGAYRGTGYAQAWMRPRIPLIAGREMHPLDRVLVVADSANGVSARLDMREWLFIPPAVTVTLHRYPVGEWVLISARSDLADDGLGSTSGTLSDSTGPVGSVSQPLLVAPAPRP